MDITPDRDHHEQPPPPPYLVRERRDPESEGESLTLRNDQGTRGSKRGPPVCHTSDRPPAPVDRHPSWDPSVGVGVVRVRRDTGVGVTSTHILKGRVTPPLWGRRGSGTPETWGWSRHPQPDWRREMTQGPTVTVSARARRVPTGPQGRLAPLRRGPEDHEEVRGRGRSRPWVRGVRPPPDGRG